MKWVLFIVLISMFSFSEALLGVSVILSPKEIYSGESTYLQMTIKNSGDKMNKGAVFTIDAPDFQDKLIIVNVPIIDNGEVYTFYREMPSIVDVSPGLKEIKYNLVYGEKKTEGFESIKIIKNPINIEINAFSDKIIANKINQFIVSINNVGEKQLNNVSVSLKSNLSVKGETIYVSSLPSKSSFKNIGFEYEAKREGDYSAELEVIFYDEKGAHSITKSFNISAGKQDNFIYLIIIVFGVLVVGYYLFQKQKKTKKK